MTLRLILRQSANYRSFLFHLLYTTMASLLPTARQLHAYRKLASQRVWTRHEAPVAAAESVGSTRESIATTQSVASDAGASGDGGYAAWRGSRGISDGESAL